MSNDNKANDTVKDENLEIKNNMINEALKDEDLKKKVDEIANDRAQKLTETALLRREIFDYKEEVLEKDLASFKEVSTPEFNKLIEKRKEVMSNIDKYSNDQLKEIKSEFDVAYYVENNLQKKRETDRHNRSSMVPTVGEGYDQSVAVKHRQFPITGKYSLRDVYSDDCWEATGAWTEEHQEYKRRNPGAERNLEANVI